MTKFRWLCTALLTLLLLVTMGYFATEANANAGTWQTRECIRYDGSKETCLRVGWSRQSDGDGVRLEQMYVTTPAGCWIFGAGTAYEDVSAFWYNPRTGAPDYFYDFGSEPDCNFVKDVSNAGSDIRSMMLQFKASQGKNRLLWRVEVFPNGSKIWHESSHSD